MGELLAAGPPYDPPALQLANKRQPRVAGPGSAAAAKAASNVQLDDA